MHQPNLDHTLHDRSLIAGLAAGDLSDPDRNRANELLASCDDCTQLQADLLAIALATRQLPAPIAPARDFRLTDAQAAGLRRGSWLRAALRPFGASRSAVRPVAAAFTSLGVAGLLVATLLPALLGQAAGGAPEQDTGRTLANAPAATAAPAFVPEVPGAQAGAPTAGDAGYAAGAHASATPGSSTAVKTVVGSTAPGAVAVSGPTASGTRSGVEVSPISRDLATASPNLLVIGSLAMLAVGVALFGLRFAGRRVR